MRLLPTSLRPVRLALAVLPAAFALTAVVVALVGLGESPRPAHAAVVRGQGFDATVLGWSSWYGSYELAGLGPAWCIDHGSHAPDADLGYAPTDVPDADRDTKAAMAWALTNHPADDGIDAASTMLVLHDLMGASYPFGPLDLDQMGPGDLAGFGGHEGTVLDRARSIKADALAHRHLRGPLSLHADAPAVAEGQTADLTVRLTDANGAPVERATVHVDADGATLLGAGHTTTGPDGIARFGYRASTGDNRFQAVAVAADPSLHAWGPTAAPAQRVARPATVEVSTHTTFVVTPPDGGIELDKTDAATGEPLAGAVFDMAFDGDGDDTFETPTGQITSGAEPVVVEGLAPGNYQLTEVSAPPGYAPLVSPFVVTVPPGQIAEVDVANTPHSTVAFEKVPVGDVDPAQVTLAGAIFAVTGPHDPPPPPPVIGDDGGDSGEDDAPTDDGSTDDERGATGATSATDPPEAADPPEADDLPEAPDVGRCTTGDDGRCALPDGALLAARQYCYREVAAPPGFGRAEPGCFTAGPAATVHRLAVEEPSTFTELEGTKLDADTDKPLAGAIYDLFRAPLFRAPLDDAPLDDDLDGGSDPPEASALPAPTPPGDGRPLDGHTWVGRAESDDRGTLAWPRQIPGFRYCAVEHRAPAGYARQPAPVCSGVLEVGVGARLTLRDEPLGPPATVPGRPPDGTPPTTWPPRDTPRAGSPDRPTHQTALPVAGVDTVPLVFVGGGLVLVGWSVTSVARRRRHHR